MAEWIIAAICAVLTVLCLMYGIRAWHCKGPILMNKYLFASDSEKLALARQSEHEKRADYRYAARISFGIALMSLSVVFGIFIHILFLWFSVFVAVMLVVYACLELFRNNRC